MPFPEEILNIKVEALVDGVWANITDYVYKESVAIERGSADESSYTQPTKCSFLLNNIDGRFSPRNPNSPYYGKIGRNTPLLVSVMGGDHFLDLPGAGRARVDNLGTPGEVDIRVDMQLWNWHQEPGRQEVMACVDLGVNAGWQLQIDNGRPRMYYGDGTNLLLSTFGTGALTVPPSGRLTVRVVIDNTNSVFRYYQGPSVDGPWDLVDEVAIGGLGAVAGNSTTLYIGDVFTADGWENINGKVFRAQVRDGESGPVLADADFTGQAIGTAPFVDDQGNTWQMSSGGHVNNQYNRFRGEVVAWPARWTTGGFDSWVTLKAESIARRYGQGVEALRSTIARSSVADPNLVAYWPMEDPDNGQRTLSALTPNTRLMGLDGAVSLAAHAGPPGSDSLPSFGTDSTWHGEVNTARYPAGSNTWKVELLTNFQQLDVEEKMFLRIQTTGTVREWRLFISQTGYAVAGYQYSSGGALVELFKNGYLWNFGTDSGSLTPNEAVNLWTKWSLEASQVGGNIQWATYGALVGFSGVGDIDTYAGTVGPVNSVMGPPTGLSSALDGLSIGHIKVFSTTAGGLKSDADVGFPGETALERAQRLADEEGENLVFVGDYEDTFTMGEQRPDRFLDLLRECATTDRGIFGDTRDVAQFSGFRFVGRSALYNQTPVLTLDYEATGEVHAPLDPTDDDLYVRNRVTVTQERGGSAIAEKPEGTLSTEPPPFGVGVYETSLTVNSDSAALLPEIAGWEVHLGTWDEERYPTVLLRLQAAPHLIPAALMIDQGTVIRIRNARDATDRTWVPPGDIDLMVRGYNETLNQFQWELELQCVPAKPYNIPVLTSTTAEPSALAHDHVDTDGTELAVALDADDTIVPVYTYAGPTWTDDVADTPFDITVGGEEMRVTAPGGIVNDNPFFDTDLTGWTTALGTSVRDTTVVHPDPSAVASLKFTPPGGVSAVSVRSDIEGVGVIQPGATYRFSGWFYSPNGWSGLCVNAQWTNAGGSVIASDFTNHDVPAGVWTFLEDDFTAPALTTGVRVCPRINNTPAATDVLYLWGVRFTRATSDWANDTFNRTVTDGWGEMDSGDDWVNSGGAAGDYDVTSGYGSHTLTSNGVARMSTITLPTDDFDLYVDVGTSVMATGDTIKGGLAARVTDDDNLYIMSFWFRTDGLLGIILAKRVGGTETPLLFIERELGYTVGSYFRLRFQGVGGRLKAKAWRQGDFESPAWHIDVQDTDLTTGGVGVYSLTNPGNTNTNPQVRYDNFRVANPQALAVERSRNNVVKTHSVGDDVRLAHPAITAL